MFRIWMNLGLRGSEEASASKGHAFVHLVAAENFHGCRDPSCLRFQSPAGKAVAAAWVRVVSDVYDLQLFGIPPVSCCISRFASRSIAKFFSNRLASQAPLVEKLE